MAFLSLRTKELDSMFPSFPQWEIEQCARIMEQRFAEEFPLTCQSFNANGRVAP
jgi:thymidylate synthase (FAD)